MILIRPATAEDIPQLVPLYWEFHNYHAAALPDYLAQPEHPDQTELIAGLQQIMANPEALLLVAESVGQLLGLAEAYLKEVTGSQAVVPRRYVLLQSLAVTAACRRHGIGQQLLGAVEQWGKERGARELELSVWEFSEGPWPFYRQQGFGTVKRTLVKWLGDTP